MYGVSRQEIWLKKLKIHIFEQWPAAIRIHKCNRKGGF